MDSRTVTIGHKLRTNVLQHLRWTLVPCAALALLCPSISSAQSVGDWRRIGNSSLDQGLASLTSGAVTRVWYSQDGRTVYARGASGATFEVTDDSQWKRLNVALTPGVPDNAPAANLPEPNARVRRGANARLYAIASDIYRSEDGGANWTNLTRYKNENILGGELLDLSVAPGSADEILVAASNGVWRSTDAGATWFGLNEGLANLPAARILGTPANGRGALIGVGNQVFEWIPGERKAWRLSERPADTESLRNELARNRYLSERIGARISASAVAGEVIYAGGEDGRLWSSTNLGATWQVFRIAQAGRVERIVPDPNDGRVALAAIGARPSELQDAQRGSHILRTLTGGGIWDDLTANLPDVPAYSVTFDRASGAIYAATAQGLFWTFGDLRQLGPATPWTPVAGSTLPRTIARDVKLDSLGNQIYAMFEGEGLLSAIAPHLTRRPTLVSAADLSTRATAPGALLTLIGSGARSAQAGELAIPLLASSDDRAEFQIPFEAQGNALQLTLASNTGTPLVFGVPLDSVAPTVFTDRDGAPMVLDAESGVLIDGSNPARTGTRIQILASGLGRVRPDWPSGVAAPVDSPPAVIAPVRVRVGGVEADVTRAVLAPGYIGFYLIEAELPIIMNAGPIDLVIEAAGRESNRTRLWVAR